MNLRILSLIAPLVLTIAVGTPIASRGQTITVDFGPGTCTQSGTSPLNFPNPYTCGNITITPKGGGSANVTAIDGNSDILRFLNATITANQPVTNMHVVVTREYVSGPTTTAANAFYKTSASGNFSTNNVGNNLSVTSSVTDKATSTTRPMFNQQDTDGDANGNSISLPRAGTPNTQWVPPPHLSGNRDLKLDFSFSLANAGDKLNLASIVLENKSTSVPGDGEGEGPGGRKQSGGGTGSKR